MTTSLGVYKTFQIPSVIQREEEFNRKKEALDSLEGRAKKLLVTWSKAHQDLCAVLARKPEEKDPRFDLSFDFYCGQSEMSAGVICEAIKELISSIQNHAGHLKRCFVDQEKCVWLEKNVTLERADDPIKIHSFTEMLNRVETLQIETHPFKEILNRVATLQSEIACISDNLGKIFDFHPAGSCKAANDDKSCATSYDAIISKVLQLKEKTNEFEGYVPQPDDLNGYIASSSNKQDVL